MYGLSSYFDDNSIDNNEQIVILSGRVPTHHIRAERGAASAFWGVAAVLDQVNSAAMKRGTYLGTCPLMEPVVQPADITRLVVLCLRPLMYCALAG